MEIGFIIIILVLISIASYLAVKFYKADRKAADADKVSGYLRPVTVENVGRMLERKGYKVDCIDSEGKDITFTINGTRFNLDLERHPLAFLYLGYGIDKDVDREALEKAAEKVTREIVMVKANVHDDGYNYLIACCESCIGHLEESLDRYLEILDDAQKKMSNAYHEFVGEKRGREQVKAVPAAPAPEEGISNNNKIMS